MTYATRAAVVRTVVWTIVLTVVLLVSPPALANQQSAALCAQAAAQIYNMDRDQAVATYRQAVTADPQDAAAYRGLASALWLSITFRRGNMTVDEYLGGVTRAKAPVGPVPPEAAAFYQALDTALGLARTRVEADPRDLDAHYQTGAAMGLRASYTATVEGRSVAAFRAAKDAYAEHERVLALDGGRKDAGLVVGTYRYIVATLALPARWIAYAIGFGGGKAQGLRMIEEAAAYPGDNQVDARLALVLLYNREKRYDEALQQLTTLREQFPKNRLLWLEAGSTNLRAGRPTEALRALNEGMTRFAADARPKMFGEQALWLYKRGTALAAEGQASSAEQDLRKSVSMEGRSWVLGRAHFELGKLALKAGRRAEAVIELRAAAALCDADNDEATAGQARRLLAS